MKLRDNNIDFRFITYDDDVDSFNCGNNSINDYLKTKSLYDSLYREGSTTLAFDNSELVGFCTLSRVNISQIDTEALLIQYLAVSSDKQDTGIGSTIIEYIVDVSLTTNERYIFLEALKDDELELIGWYKRRGFIITDEDELEDSTKSKVWMYMDLLDEESLEMIFNNP